MNKYWLFPVLAIAAVTASLIHAITSEKPPKYEDNVATFAHSMKIEGFQIQDAHAADRHKLAVFTMTPGAMTGITLGVHLAGPNGELVEKVGEFEVSKYCTGTSPLTCSIPLSLDGFERSQNLGLAAYKIPGQLLEVTYGRSDWDGHRALFFTNGYHAVP